MRVGIDLQTAVNQPTGVGQYAFYLARHLPSISPSDKFIGLVFGRKGKVSFPTGFPNLHVRQIRYLPARGISLLWKTIDWPPADFFTGPVDIFHFPSFVARRLRSGKAIVTIHDMAFKRMPEFCESKNVAFLEKHIPRTLERAALVLVDSEFTARELQDIYSFPRERIRVIYLGVDEKFRPAGKSAVEQVRHRYGLPEKFILCVATIEPRKNLPRLIEAYSLLKKRKPDAPELVIAGSGGWRGENENIERLIDSFKLRDEVIRIGYLEYDSLTAIYAAAGIFVFPSIYEGFGLPPLEAMACGTPVVCSNAASLLEVVGDAALMVQPRDAEAMADAMERLLGDKGLREQLIKKGLERAKAFSWSDMASRTLDAYREALRI